VSFIIFTASVRNVLDKPSYDNKISLLRHIFVAKIHKLSGKHNALVFGRSTSTYQKNWLPLPAKSLSAVVIEAEGSSETSVLFLP
jgi:hypothetical protein